MWRVGVSSCVLRLYQHGCEDACVGVLSRAFLGARIRKAFADRLRGVWIVVRRPVRGARVALDMAVP